MQDPNIKNIRFPLETDRQLIKLAAKHGRSKVAVFRQMVEYFYRTKKDPLDINDELLKSTVVKGHQHIAGFIKVQEQTLLIPMKHEVARMIASQEKILECFNEHILGYNRQHGEKLERLEKLLATNSQPQANKEQLKTKFLYILENYAKSREQGSSLNREELLRRAKEQIRLL